MRYPDRQLSRVLEGEERRLTAGEACIVALVFTGCTCTILWVAFTLIGTYHQALAAALPPVFGLSIAARGWSRKGKT